jgi:transmembrane sensor
MRDELAAAHVARLLSGGDEADQRRIADWIEADPRNAVAFARAEAAWEAAGRLRASPPSLGAPAQSDRLVDVPRRRLLGALISAAAAASVVAVAWVVRPQGASFSTAVGEQRQVTLADGSHVLLNTASTIEVVMRRARREVRLLKGEALFSVAHDPSRPFVVTAEGARIRAVGTAFNVRLRKTLVELTVTDGLVAVTTAEARARRPAPALIPAREGAVIGRSIIAPVRLDEQSLQRRTQWRTGVIEFDGETLEQVVDEFNRYRSKPIVIDDPAVASTRVGGRFELRESDKFLAALQSSFPIDAITDAGGGVLLTPRRTNSDVTE